MTVPYPVPHRSWIRLGIVAYQSAQSVTAPTASIAVPGSGYQDGDVVTLPAFTTLGNIATTGYCITPASFRLTVISGVATAAVCVDSGDYPYSQTVVSKLPANPVSVTGGHGNGLTLTITWGAGVTLNSSGQWIARNGDWLSGPAVPALYATQNDAPRLFYINLYCQNIGLATNANMVAWCQANGIDPETMYLHYKSTTTVTFNDGNGAKTLPGYGGLYSDGTSAPLGSKVPTYNWYGNVGLPYKYGSRVVMNVKDANYQAWVKSYYPPILQAAGLTGVYVDNSEGGAAPDNQKAIPELGSVSSGSTQVFSEYPSPSGMNAAAIAWDSDYVLCVAALNSVFLPLNFSIYPNVSRGSWPALFDYCTGFFLEFFIKPRETTYTFFNSDLSTIAISQAAGKPSIVTATGLYDQSPPTAVLNYDGYAYNDWILSTLAQYYLMASSTDYYCQQDFNGGDPLQYLKVGALDYNVGVPISSGSTPLVASTGATGCYLFATGLDPSSPTQLAGTGTWGYSGISSWLYDPTLTYAAYNNKYVIYNGQSYSIGSVAAGPGGVGTVLRCATGPSPTPVGSQSYLIGDYIYSIYARKYSNALVLFKPFNNNNALPPGITAASATIANTGSGYTDKDIVTVLDLTNGGSSGVSAYGAQAQFLLTVTNGVVTAAVPAGATKRKGNYSTFPTNPVAVRGGTGTGLTLNLTQTPGTLSSTTTHNLPTSPTGSWYFLNVDFSGVVSNPTPLTQISLANGTAAILATATASTLVAATITANPASVSINVGQQASFVAAATGNPVPSMQWQVNTGSGWAQVSDGGIYSGSATSTLTITGATTAMSGYQYRAVASNSQGAATSTTATLTVTSPVVVVPNPCYVDITNGSDGLGNGTISKPYKTLKFVHDALTASTAGTIVLRGGTYADAIDNWTWTKGGASALSPLVITSYPGETVLIHNGVQPTWTLAGGVWSCRLTTAQAAALTNNAMTAPEVIPLNDRPAILCGALADLTAPSAWGHTLPGRPLTDSGGHLLYHLTYYDSASRTVYYVSAAPGGTATVTNPNTQVMVSVSQFSFTANYLTVQNIEWAYAYYWHWQGTSGLTVQGCKVRYMDGGLLFGSSGNVVHQTLVDKTGPFAVWGDNTTGYMQPSSRHAIYASGANDQITGNVFGRCYCGGAQFYDGTAQGLSDSILDQNLFLNLNGVIFTGSRWKARNNAAIGVDHFGPWADGSSVVSKAFELEGNYIEGTTYGLLFDNLGGAASDFTGGFRISGNFVNGAAVPTVFIGGTITKATSLIDGNTYSGTPKFYLAPGVVPSNQYDLSFSQWKTAIQAAISPACEATSTVVASVGTFDQPTLNALLDTGNITTIWNSMASWIHGFWSQWNAGSPTVVVPDGGGATVNQSMTVQLAGTTATLTVSGAPVLVSVQNNQTYWGPTPLTVGEHFEFGRTLVKLIAVKEFAMFVPPTTATNLGDVVIPYCGTAVLPPQTIQLRTNNVLVDPPNSGSNASPAWTTGTAVPTSDADFQIVPLYNGQTSTAASYTLIWYSTGFYVLSVDFSQVNAGAGPNSGDALDCYVGITMADGTTYHTYKAVYNPISEGIQGGVQITGENVVLE